MSDVSKQDKRTRKALRSYRCRTLKNLLIWFIGMLTCIVLLVGSVFIGIKVIPISTYTGGNNEEYVSDDIASSSILDAVLNIDKYKMADLPVLTNLVDSLLNDAGLKDYVTVDQEKLKELEQMLPILHEKYKDFAEYYCKFKITNETLRTYAARGIIKRDQIPDFRPESLTDLFYKSRKKRKI